MGTIINNIDEAEELVQKSKHTAYLTNHYWLTKDDIELLQTGKFIYDTCNGEYGIVIGLDGFQDVYFDD